jgi:hypothetical protein
LTKQERSSKISARGPSPETAWLNSEIKKKLDRRKRIRLQFNYPFPVVDPLQFSSIHVQAGLRPLSPAGAAFARLMRSPIMHHNTKREHHEQARRRHRQDQMRHARDVAKQKPSAIPRWFLYIGLACILLFVLVVTLR